MIMETFSLAKGESRSRAGSSWERSRPLEEMNQIAYECLHSDLDKARLRGAGHASSAQGVLRSRSAQCNRGNSNTCSRPWLFGIRRIRSFCPKAVADDAMHQKEI